MAKGWITFFLSCLLIGVAHADDWEIRSWKDAITDKESIAASKKSLDGDSEMRIACVDDVMMVSFHLPSLASNGPLFDVDYRVDERPGVVDREWLNVNGGAFVLGTFEFIDELAASDGLLVRIGSEVASPKMASFDITSFGGVKEEINQVCPDVAKYALSADHKGTVAACWLEAFRQDNAARMPACVAREEHARQWLASNPAPPGVIEDCRHELNSERPFSGTKGCVQTPK